MKKIFFIMQPWILIISVVLLFAGINESAADEGKIPITTSSDEALDLFIQARTLDENLLNSKAKELYLKAIELDPDFAMAHLNLAINETSFTVYFKMIEKIKSLVEKVTEGERLLIESVVVGIDGNPHETREPLLKLVTLYPNDERANFNLGNNYYGQQEYEDAIGYYTKAIEINSDYAPAYNMLGYAYQLVKKYDESEEAFKAYISLIPNDPNPYDSYGELLFKMSRYDESLEAYKKALEQDPSFTISRIGVASNHCMKLDYTTAHAELDTALDKASGDGDRRTVLTARAIAFIDEGKKSEALDAINKRYEFADASNDVLLMSNDKAFMGQILFDMDSLDAAMEMFTSSRDLIINSDLKETIKDQAEANYIFNETTILLKKGKFGKAKENAMEYMGFAAKIQNLNTKRAAHQLIGMISLEEENYDRAITELKQANPVNPYNLYRIGKAYQSKGLNEEAKGYFEQAANFNLINSYNYALIRKVAAQELKPL